jgi:hypothetical protein
VASNDTGASSAASSSVGTTSSDATTGQSATIAADVRREIWLLNSQLAEIQEQIERLESQLSIMR